jgi:radical SAM superfamily enzyme YgiQ (UPF0313 family)
MRVLLSSVFGPYGVDDAYGRKENIMELFHNQITREQDLFSLRFHHHSFGLYFIAENIQAPTTVLDFPSQDAFILEIKKGYDAIGISFIVPNFAKAKRMATLIREYAPQSKIILGGHGTQVPGIEELIEHDYICRGEGVAWFRKFLGEDPKKALNHPVLPSGFSKRIVGVPQKTSAAVLIPGVGCPNACRFCATSHFFGKKYTAFFDTGQELFDICQKLERELGSTEFFVMDENFLKRPERARELLSLMEKNNKYYRFGIFSSAEAVSQVGVEFLARLGVYFLWIGVESKFEIYEKNRSIDLAAMISQLKDHGISVLASAILFLEQHDRQTIWDDIQFVVELGSDMVQFMQLGPMPGTRLYEDYDRLGTLRKDIPFEEWHGQHRLWFKHPNFSPAESENLLRQAFRYDYNQQGATLLRMCETVIRGVRKLADYQDDYLRERRRLLRQKAASLRPILEVLKKYAHNRHVRSLTQSVIDSYSAELGPLTFKQKMLSKVALAYAAFETYRVTSKNNVYQPRTFRTNYRIPARILIAEQLQQRLVSFADFQAELQNQLEPLARSIPVEQRK